MNNAITIALHTTLSHLDKWNTYVRMLFIDYNSAFNTILPFKLVIKLRAFCLNSSLCKWILDFLRGGNNTSAMMILNTGAPQGCGRSPLLYSLFTHDCVAMHDSIIKFTDDTIVVGLINNNDETAYREEVRALVEWCQENNLSLNVNQTKGQIANYRRQKREHAPILRRAAVDKVKIFKFLNEHITEDLVSSFPTTLVTCLLLPLY